MIHVTGCTCFPQFTSDDDVALEALWGVFEAEVDHFGSTSDTNMRYDASETISLSEVNCRKVNYIKTLTLLRRI